MQVRERRRSPFRVSRVRVYESGYGEYMVNWYVRLPIDGRGNQGGMQETETTGRNERGGTRPVLVLVVTTAHNFLRQVAFPATLLAPKTVAGKF